MTTLQTLQIPVRGMTCAGCAGRVERGLLKVPGVEQAVINLVTNEAIVHLNQPVALTDLVAAVEASGYQVPLHGFDFAVSGMNCGSCVARIEKALAQSPIAISYQVNLSTKQAHVQLLAGEDPELISQWLTEHNYPAQVLADNQRKADDLNTRQEAEQSKLKKQLKYAFLFATPLFILEMGAHFIPPFHDFLQRTFNTQHLWYAQAILAALVLFGPGREILIMGWHGLRRLAPDMNSLVALGTLAAFGYSMIATFVPQILPAQTVNVYFEASAVIIALILLGRYLEARAKGNASDAIKRLINLQPREARVLVDEYVRTFISQKQRDTCYSDISLIAAIQFAQELAARAQQPKLLLLDTHLLSNMLWSRTLFDDCPAWIEAALLGEHYDLTLLLSPQGMPWQADGMRCQPQLAERQQFFQQAKDWLVSHEQPYQVLTGDWPQRQQQAYLAVQQLLQA